MKKAVILLSGGLDSTTTLYWAKNQGYTCVCLIFDYGQRHRKEIQCAITIAEITDCQYHIIKFQLPWLGSALLDKRIPIPNSPLLKGGRGLSPTEIPSTCVVPFNPKSKIQNPKFQTEIPSTYVPARNTIFLSFALSYAEAIGVQTILIGANALDYSGYPDCRPEYYEAFKKVAALGIKQGVEGKPIEILTPLIDKTKAEIVKLGFTLNVPFELTWSCYKGGTKPCGKCDSCVLRSKGFNEVKTQDPIIAKGSSGRQEKILPSSLLPSTS
ncbi:MAG: 7-cyano-7-deazaguanine synthase QueC [bacterium]|nr:7-cyano-7-deazaguanine synthase QueC [bacterium]